jgi:hypothetical protein
LLLLYPPPPPPETTERIKQKQKKEKRKPKGLHRREKNPAKKGGELGVALLILGLFLHKLYICLSLVSYSLYSTATNSIGVSLAKATETAAAAACDCTFVIKETGEHQRHVIRSKTTSRTGNEFLPCSFLKNILFFKV